MSLGTISGNNMVWETVYKHMPSPIWEAGPVRRIEVDMRTWTLQNRQGAWRPGEDELSR